VQDEASPAKAAAAVKLAKPAVAKKAPLVARTAPAEEASGN
jgi:hypothetical protein